MVEILITHPFLLNIHSLGLTIFSNGFWICILKRVRLQLSLIVFLFVFFDPKMNDFCTSLGRNVTHAILLSGHEETISCLLNKKPELLNECDPFKRTALHIAADEGDLQSVKILLNR